MERERLIAAMMAEGLTREEAEQGAELELARAARRAQLEKSATPTADTEPDPPAPKGTDDGDIPTPASPDADSDPSGQVLERLMVLGQESSRLRVDLLQVEGRLHELEDHRGRLSECERVAAEAAEGFRELSLRTFQCEKDLGRVPGGVRPPDRPGVVRAPADVPSGGGSAGDGDDSGRPEGGA